MNVNPRNHSTPTTKRRYKSGLSYSYLIPSLSPKSQFSKFLTRFLVFSPDFKCIFFVDKKSLGTGTLWSAENIPYLDLGGVTEVFPYVKKSVSIRLKLHTRLYLIP